MSKLELQPGLRTRMLRVRLWWRGLLRSFGYAWQGIGWTVRTQRNAQIHVLALLGVVGAGWLFGVSAGEWLALILAMALVLALELLNTAIEAVVDLAMPQHHPLAKRAKDAAAGAVLIAALGAAVVGLIVFAPKIWAWLP